MRSTKKPTENGNPSRPGQKTSRRYPEEDLIDALENEADASPRAAAERSEQYRAVVGRTGRTSVNRT